MVRILLLTISFLIISTEVRSQDTLSVMTYNLMNFSGSTPERVVYFRNTLDKWRPDILVVNEMQTEVDVNLFLDSTLNHNSSEYLTGDFFQGNDTENAVYYNKNRVNYFDGISVQTRLRRIDGYRFTIKNHKDPSFQFQVFSSHLKASDTSENATRRLVEIQDFNDRIKTGAVDSSYIFAGDFNIYRSSEPGYQFLMDSMAIDLEDPINAPGNWHDAESFALIHTQSTRNTASGEGSSGGLDDRFDFILMSKKLIIDTVLTYVDGSYLAIGNDGNRFNFNVLDDSLRLASDHLPVYAELSFPSVPLTPTGLTADSLGSRIQLTWDPYAGRDLHHYGIYRRIQGETLPDTASPTYSSLESSFTDTLFPGEGSYEYAISFFDNAANESEMSSFTSATIVSVGDESAIPVSYALLQNYPNPFNPVTAIVYILPKESKTTLTIYNLLGREVAKLVNENQPAGVYSVKWDASTVSTGVYFYKLQADDFVKVKKMVLIK